MREEESSRHPAIDRCLSYCVFTARDTGQVLRKIHARFGKGQRAGVILALALLALAQATGAWLLRLCGRAGR